MADRTLRFNIFTRDTNTKRTLEGIADAAEDANDEFKDMARGAEKLDNEIGDLEREILKLKVAMAGLDGDAFKDMDRTLRGLEGTLRRKMNVKKAFSDAGDDGAMAISASFSQRIGPLLLKAPLSAPVAAGIAAGAPVIASAVAGAVTAGVGLAAVGAGLKLAFTDASVKAAGADLAKEVTGIFKGAARPFVSETIDAMGKVRAAIRSVKPELEGLFADSSKFVQPLADGLSAGIRKAIPDLRDAVANAEPLVDVMGEHLPKAIDTTTSSLKQLSTGSAESAKTLDALLTAAEVTVGGTATLLSTLGKNFELVAGGYPAVLRDEIARLGDTTSDTSSDVSGITGWLGQYTEVAGKSAFATMSLEDQIRQLADAASSAFDSETRLSEAIADATSKMHKNKAGLDANSEAGRANRDALSRLAAQTMATRDATVAQTKSSVHGEQVMQRGYDAFMKAARGMGVSKKEADKLARSLGLIPPAKNVAVSVATSGAIAKVNVLKAKIAELRNRNVYITGTVRWISTGLKVPGGTILRHEGGMVPGSMAVNRDVVPAMLTPGEGVLNRAGVRAIGGKAGLDVLNRGKGFVPGAAPAGNGGQTLNLTINITRSGNDNEKQLARRISDEVSRVIARAGDRRARGG